MSLLGLTEHFLPRIGGTSHYVQETCAALARLGTKVHLIAPGPKPEGIDLDALPYRITWVDVGYPQQGDPPRDVRYRFCNAVNDLAQELAAAGAIDAVHVMFGLFLMEELDITKLADKGVASIATVHNVPPMECRQSWPSAPILHRLRDMLRVKAVAAKNGIRLRRYQYDRYIVPSMQVAEKLGSILSSKCIEVIPHGVSEDLLAQMSSQALRRPMNGAPWQFLTIGGWAPHKRQMIIPDVADALRRNDVDFRWRVLGPTGRVSGYKSAVDTRLVDLGLTDLVCTSGPVPFSELPALYDTAHLYVQPSIEEGFCLTALDAAAAGLPVVGGSAGALPDICKLSRGKVVASEPMALADAITQLIEPSSKMHNRKTSAMKIRKKYTWEASATQLNIAYENAININRKKVTMISNLDSTMEY